MPQAPRDQRNRERQRGHQVPRREPEAEHGRREERGHEQLRAESRRAQARGELHLAHVRHRPRQLLPARSPQPPDARERQQQHRRPAQQAVAAVDEQRHEPIRPLGVSDREGGAGGRLAGVAGRVRRGPAVDRLVDRHVEREREQRHLHGSHRERSPPRPPDRAHREGAHHQAGRHELRPQPWERSEEDEAQRRLLPSHARGQPHGQERRAGERGRRGQLGIDRRAVGQQRRAEADGKRGAERPRVRRHAQRQPVGERDRQRRDRRQEQLHAPRTAHRVRGRDQEREADPVRLVQASPGLPSLRVEPVRVEVRVGALRVLVAHVHVAVVHDRVRREQVVRLVAAVVGAGECVEPDRRGVDAEEEQPEGKGAAHGAAP